MGTKYIIELPENTHWIQWIMQGTKDGHPYMDYKQVEDLTPYTEPDLEQVREKAYIQGLKDGQVVAVANEQNNAFNDGYKKCLKDMEQVREEAYEKGYKTAKCQCNIQAEKDLREVGKRHYQKGLSDAWDAAKKIVLSTEDGGLFGYDKRKAVFGCGNYMALKKYSASEAIEKIRQYEQEKEEIKVGDEVKDGKDIGIVTSVPRPDAVYVMWKDGSSGSHNTEDFRKTGRHFPEIAAVLEKMKGV